MIDLSTLFSWGQTAVEIYLAIVGVASIIVKLTPTLKDNDWLLAVTKFIAKYIALNVNAPTVRPK